VNTPLAGGGLIGTVNCDKTVPIRFDNGAFRQERAAVIATLLVPSLSLSFLTAVKPVPDNPYSCHRAPPVSAWLPPRLRRPGLSHAIICSAS